MAEAAAKVVVLVEATVAVAAGRMSPAAEIVAAAGLSVVVLDVTGVVDADGSATVEVVLTALVGETELATVVPRTSWLKIGEEPAPVGPVMLMPEGPVMDNTPFVPVTVTPETLFFANAVLMSVT